jgi:transcriptional regulator with XRE-family HTH domain
MRLKMTLEEIQAKLRDMRPGPIAEALGISRQALWKIMVGKTKNPSPDLMDRLRGYLEGR